MIIGLDHVAIAVPDLEKSIKRFAEDFGLDFKGSETVEDAKTQTAFFPISGTQIELVHPLNGEGPVQKYLDKKGGGLHHICFKSDDVAADMERLTEKGYIFLSDAPKPGAHNTLVAFIHPKCTDGVLIEIAEHPKDH
ncbi:MAG: methylmalonyl-CoA epimerase [Moraxellaceae bacterium]|nr:MAG: methylmalonyl-CoA epimerase [Moraxellaceae bacterium]